MYMNDKHIDDLINKALREEGELPEGLSDRLEQHINKLAEKEEKTSKAWLMRKRSIYWFSGVAAALILCIALFFQTENIQDGPTTADTFNDPQEAAIVAQEALAFLSIHLNKGLDQVSEANEEMNKVNKIVNKQLNEINAQ